MLTTLRSKQRRKMQWLDDLRQITLRDSDNITREASKIFRNMKREHLKAKIMSLKHITKTRTLDLYVEEKG
jgi:hypothetical protein